MDSRITPNPDQCGADPSPVTSTVPPLVNIAAFEASQNPDGKGAESDPWDLVVRGSDTFVSDAAGNSLVKADSTNQASLGPVFPSKRVSSTPNAPIPLPPVFSAQGVDAGHDTTLRLWEAATCKPLGTIQLGVPLLAVACAQTMIVVTAKEGPLAICIGQPQEPDVCPQEEPSLSPIASGHRPPLVRRLLRWLP
jgi:hypothetical protein